MNAGMLSIRAGTVLGAFLSTAAAVQAQCLDGVWQPFDAAMTSYPGTNGLVYAMTMWDPDGAGPLTPRVVLGGQFTLAGSALASGVAALDPSTGAVTALGSGVGGSLPVVRAVAPLSDGVLIAGGDFAIAGGVPVNHIARWDGLEWSAMGDGLQGATPSPVLAVTAVGNDDVVAAGNFTSAGGSPALRVARWDGSAWSTMGDGLSNTVFALAAMGNGDVIAGGAFTTSGVTAVKNIARWDCDASGGLNIDDFICFQTQFAVGC